MPVENSGEAESMLWVIAGGLFVVWSILLLMGKGGLVHVLILNAIAIAAVKFMAVRRARV
jgi:hypothetical protein